MSVRFTSFEYYSSMLKSPTEDKLPSSKVLICMLNKTDPLIAGQNFLTRSHLSSWPRCGHDRSGLDCDPYRCAQDPATNLAVQRLQKSCASVGWHNQTRRPRCIVEWRRFDSSSARNKSSWYVGNPRFATQSSPRSNLVYTANFLAYQTIRRTLLDLQPQHQKDGLPGWQVALNGFCAGSLGPMVNSPIDALSKNFLIVAPGTATTDAFASCIETRTQRLTVFERQQTSIPRILQDIIQTQGFRGLYRGLVPRVLRVGLGQSVVFCTYEFLKTVFVI